MGDDSSIRELLSLLQLALLSHTSLCFAPQLKRLAKSQIVNDIGVAFLVVQPIYDYLEFIFAIVTEMPF